MSLILVTGAGGFVGSHAAQALKKAGHAVVGLLGPSDTYAPPVDALLRGDILDSGLLERAMDGVQHVVHAAGPPSVAESFADPARFARAHVAGTAAVMKAACDAAVRSVVHTSSAEVYGRPSREPVREEDPCQPISPYGAAKLGAEWMARTVCRSGGLRLAILRPFSLYGPRMREGSLLGRILSQLEAETVELHDLRPVRDYLHIDDLCALILAVLPGHENCVTLNACSGRGVSVRELVEVALAGAGSSARLVTKGAPDRPVDVESLIGSRDAAARLVGWEPRIGLEAGIAGLARP